LDPIDPGNIASHVTLVPPHLLAIRRRSANRRGQRTQSRIAFLLITFREWQAERLPYNSFGGQTPPLQQLLEAAPRVVMKWVPSLALCRLSGYQNPFRKCWCEG
jgi:hypothetical protein